MNKVCIFERIGTLENKIFIKFFFGLVLETKVQRIFFFSFLLKDVQS